MWTRATFAKLKNRRTSYGIQNSNGEYLRADDSSVRLRGTKGKQGKSKEGTAVALTVLFGPIGLIQHGRNAQFEEATPLVAYVDQDTVLQALE